MKMTDDLKLFLSIHPCEGCLLGKPAVLCRTTGGTVALQSSHLEGNLLHCMAPHDPNALFLMCVLIIVMSYVQLHTGLMVVPSNLTLG